MDTEPAISVESLWKSFSNETVLQDIDLDIETGEFCVIVGPSGSGKSTLLQCIAGLLDFERGTVRLNGERADEVSVEDRDIGYVFQEFEETLFPHKTVAENIAFGLEQKEQEYSSEEIDGHIDDMLDLLAISETKENVPTELSGGQQQRVELARQLVRDCDVMLLDDPLADLDYKLQKRMELEMRRVHEELESTFVYVTHNQDQALKLADKLVVMNQGMIEQIGTPEEVYRSPASAFVGQFVGDSNPFVGQPIGSNGHEVDVETDVGVLSTTTNNGVSPSGSESLVTVRPETMTIGEEARQKDNTVTGVLEGWTYVGEETEYSFSVDGLAHEIQVVKPGSPYIEGDGEEYFIGWNAEDAQYFEDLSVTDTVTIADLMEV